MIECCNPRERYIFQNKELFRNERTFLKTAEWPDLGNNTDVRKKKKLGKLHEMAQFKTFSLVDEFSTREL